jgi:hypothetical protein
MTRMDGSDGWATRMDGHLAASEATAVVELARGEDADEGALAAVHVAHHRHAHVDRPVAVARRPAAHQHLPAVGGAAEDGGGGGEGSGGGGDVGEGVTAGGGVVLVAGLDLPQGFATALAQAALELGDEELEADGGGGGWGNGLQERVQ